MTDSVLLDALVKNTEAITNMNSTLVSFQQESAQLRQATREHVLDVGSKLENVDRSLSEFRLALENDKRSRSDEQARILELLSSEREDRKNLTALASNAGQDERDLIKEILREEFGGRRDNRNMLVAGSKAVWAVGGKQIVGALALLIVAGVMKITGISLADIMGVAK